MRRPSPLAHLIFLLISVCCALLIVTELVAR